jgi:hypothetical protein
MVVQLKLKGIVTQILSNEVVEPVVDAEPVALK